MPGDFEFVTGEAGYGCGLREQTHLANMQVLQNLRANTVTPKIGFVANGFILTRRNTLIEFMELR
jgi:hypothetical protein